MRPDRTMEIHYYDWRLGAWAMSETRNRLDAAGRGIYRELLDQCYAQGSFPNDIEWICRTCACTPEQYGQTWPFIRRHFIGTRGKKAFRSIAANIFRKKTFEYLEGQAEKRRAAICAKRKQISDIHKLPTELAQSLPISKLEASSIRTKRTEGNERNETQRTTTVGTDFPEAAAAIRGYFPAADDAVVVVVANEACRAYTEKVNGFATAPPFTDALLAEAIHEAHFSKQKLPVLFQTTVPRVVKSWAEEAIRNGTIH